MSTDVFAHLLIGLVCLVATLAIMGILMVVVLAVVTRILATQPNGNADLRMLLASLGKLIKDLAEATANMIRHQNRNKDPARRRPAARRANDEAADRRKDDSADSSPTPPPQEPPNPKRSASEST